MKIIKAIVPLLALWLLAVGCNKNESGTGNTGNMGGTNAPAMTNTPPVH
ncbi:MAG TPA: hypothetical protein VF988_15820 [Verrucomicrobiae bacterium]